MAEGHVTRDTEAKRCEEEVRKLRLAQQASAMRKWRKDNPEKARAYDKKMEAAPATRRRMTGRFRSPSR